MTGDERETKPASPAPEDPANPAPISSGDFPSLPISPIDSHSTAVIHVRPPVPPVPNLPTRRKIGKYGLIKEIGRGGMGVVYHAHQDDLNRDVALKVIPSGPDADQTEVARFQAEAETAANLHHPNIVPVYDVGTADGLSYLAMELIDGGSLFRLISRKPLEPIVAARLLEPVARAMHYAHAQGVIHRDLKPSNILLSSPEVSSGNPRHSPEGDLIPKITDFGLAKRLDRPLALTQTGLAVGTPHYMAPEQALGKSDQISPLTDVYALGAILYEMLTGHPPFGAGSSLETMQQVVSRKPVPPSSLQASIPRELEEICLKCLEKKPGNRYQSALAVAEVLHHFQHRTEPPTILARTPLEPESDDSLWARQSREWYFWPLLALTLSLFVGLASWQITHRHWLSVSREMARQDRVDAKAEQALDEQSREISRVQLGEERFRNTMLLADQGDFDSFPASADSADQKTVLAAYRQQLLTKLGPIEFKAPGGRVWFDHSADQALTLSDRQLTTLGFESGNPKSPAEECLVRGRSNRGKWSAFVNVQGRLTVRGPREAAPKPFDCPAGITIVQPLEDGHTIALSDGRNRWTLDSEGPGMPVPNAGETPITGITETLAVSEQGRWLVATAEGLMVLPGGKEPAVTVPFPGIAAEVVFSPTGSHLLAILRNGATRLFDLQEQRWQDLPADGLVTTATFSSDGNLLVVGTRAGTVRLWDVWSRTRLSGAANVDRPVISADIDDSQQKVVALTADGRVHRFNNPARPFFSPAIRLENQPHKDIVDIAFSGDGTSLYVTTPLGLSRWDIKSATRQVFGAGQELSPAESFAGSWVRPRQYRSMSLRTKGKEDQLLMGGSDGKMASLRVPDQGQPIRTTGEMESGSDVTGFAQNDAGTQSVAVARGATEQETVVKFWEADSAFTGQNKPGARRFNFQVTAQCFTHDGLRVMLGSDDGVVRFWDPSKPDDELSRRLECGSRVICLTTDSSGNQVFVGCANGEAILFDIETGQKRRTLKHRTEVRKVAFQGERPITAAADGTIRVWHPSIDFTLGPPMRHGDSITAISIRGNLLAAGSRDRTIRVWNLTSSK